VEVAGEGGLDALADPECTVGLYVDGNVGREEREAVGAGRAGQRKCGNRGDSRER
jgi:hypothetical protein